VDARATIEFGTTIPPQAVMDQNQHELFCSYRNTTDRMIIVQCRSASDFYLERVVFPFELLSFECPQESTVQIWSQGIRGAELKEAIPALTLAMAEPSPPRRPEWLPLKVSRLVGVRDNASSVCLEQG
jgi:hypothetical protein